MNVQELALSLSAAGSARCKGDDGEGLYLLHVEDGNLVEKLRVGDSVQSETAIASGVKEGTSAPYLLDQENDLVRLVHFSHRARIPKL